MAGPSSPLLPVSEALARLIAAAKARAPATESVPITEADGRFLAENIIARRTQPPFAMSAMDGYALRAADTQSAQPLRVIGESAAGHPFTGALQSGEAVRIFTGAAVPPGADAVLMQEQARREGDILHVPHRLEPGAFVRAAGRDFSIGDVGLEAGMRLDPSRLALAAAMNHAALPVGARPRVALLATGDELAAPGPDAPADATIASNILGIAALARRAGAIVIDLGIARDNAASLDAAFDRALAEKADLLVTIGGASVGTHDLVRPVLSARGAILDFYRIAMRPGKPLNFGRLGDNLYLGLPGNPVSALCCATLFLVPLIEALQGAREAGADRSEPALLGRALPANDQREDYLRARLTYDAGCRLVATPLPDQDSSLLMVLAAADALLIRPAHAPEAQAGTACRILRLP